jgi:hypothetical protein
MNRDVVPPFPWNGIPEQGESAPETPAPGTPTPETYTPETPTPEPPAPETYAPGTRREPSSIPGRIALGLSLLLLVLDVVALVLADNRSWVAATVLAQVATVGTIVAFVVGAGSIIASRGRRWGIVAVVLAVVANPIILTKVLGFLAG